MQEALKRVLRGYPVLLHPRPSKLNAQFYLGKGSPTNGGPVFRVGVQGSPGCGKSGSAAAPGCVFGYTLHFEPSTPFCPLGPSITFPLRHTIPNRSARFCDGTERILSRREGPAPLVSRTAR